MTTALVSIQIQDLIVNDTCPVDVNDNGLVDVGDVLLVLSDFSCLSNCEYDVNGDDMISVADILLLLSSFGDPCP